MRHAGFVLFIVTVVSMTGISTGQDAKDAPKVKGFLPMNWKELGLTDEQKQKIYTIQNKYSKSDKQ